ncbi:MAG: NUDIX domain-containing protein [Sulfitobacter sp.]
MRNLFFYGTLRHLPLLELVLGRGLDHIKQSPAVLGDYAALSVAEGPFPALTAQSGARAEGVFVEGLDARDIARLDFYEGSFAYDLIETRLEGGQMAEVYLPQPGRWQLRDAWSLAAWEAEWAALSVEAAREVMGYFGVKSRAQVDAMFPMIRARAASKLNAANSRHGAGLLGGEVQVQSHNRAYADYFMFDEYQLRHSKFDGSLSDVLDRGVFVTVDVAIVLPYDPVRDRVLLVEQFRIGPWRRGDKPWQLEPIAGRLDPGEAPDDCARREAQEEAGISIGALEKIAECYPSPGTSTEFYHMYVGICDLPDEVAGLGGLPAEYEDIRSHLLSFEALMAMNAGCAVANAPLVTASYWLSHHRNRLRSGQGAATS